MLFAAPPGSCSSRYRFVASPSSHPKSSVLCRVLPESEAEVFSSHHGHPWLQKVFLADAPRQSGFAEIPGWKMWEQSDSFSPQELQPRELGQDGVLLLLQGLREGKEQELEIPGRKTRPENAADSFAKG